MSAFNEVLAINWAMSRCEQALTSYPTTLEEDEAIVRTAEEKGEPLSPRRVSAIMVRVGEKEVLATAVEQLEVMKAAAAAGRCNVR